MPLSRLETRSFRSVDMAIRPASKAASCKGIEAQTISRIEAFRGHCRPGHYMACAQQIADIYAGNATFGVVSSEYGVPKELLATPRPFAGVLFLFLRWRDQHLGMRRYQVRRGLWNRDGDFSKHFPFPKIFVPYFAIQCTRIAHPTNTACALQGIKAREINRFIMR